MTKHPFWYLVIGISVLVIPTAVYLIFLIPKMAEEYLVLMSSAGIIGGTGIYLTDKIPDSLKYGALFKTASRSLNAVIVIALVEEFIGQLIGLFVTFIASLIIFKILVGVWKDAKRRKQDRELAKEVAQSVAESIK